MSLIKQGLHLIKGSKVDDKGGVQYVNVYISKDVLAEFFLKTGLAYAVSKGLPKDAQLIRFRFDKNVGYFVATFEHPSFDRVAFISKIPVVEVEMTAYQLLSLEESKAIAQETVEA